MLQRVAILHYASPPIIGGVESMIGYQAQGLSQAGVHVRVISGLGEPLPEPIETHFYPLFSSNHPDVLSLKAELDAGQVTDAFDSLRDQILAYLDEALADCDVLIAHNIHTMNKNLALTAALHQYGETHPIRQIAYCSDLAATNPQYQAEFYPGYPWNLLREAWPGVRYVTISPARQAELATLLGLEAEAVTVITPGIAVDTFWGWTETTRSLVDEFALMDADLILLAPMRLTRRKNVEMALQILAALRQQTAIDCRLIVTGPPGPHNPSNLAYLENLLSLRQTLGLEPHAHFLYAAGPDTSVPLRIDDPTMSNLYQLSDGLLFPSTQEGFGIPILEAGLARLPIFCADIPPLRHTAQADAFYFHPAESKPTEIAAGIWSTLSQSSAYRLSLRVRHNYRWDQIITGQWLPLMEAL